MTRYVQGPRHAGNRPVLSLCVPAVTLIIVTAGTVALILWAVS